MAGEYGISSETDTLQQLIVEDCSLNNLLIDAAVPCVVGQVVQYNVTNDNYDAYTSGMAATHYAVIAEDKTLSGDTLCACIISGKVRKVKLDATAQADAEINTALSKHGIIAVIDNVRLS